MENKFDDKYVLNKNDFYNENNLAKYLLSSVYKKNWEQRLQWFEYKIISFYKNMNKNNILIIGRKSFIDTFKELGKNMNRIRILQN